MLLLPRMLLVLVGPSCWRWVRAESQHSGWMRGDTLVHDLWCESWTCYIYFFGCLCFWSHPSLMTERWQLCFFLDWSPFVKDSVRIFKFWSVARIGKQKWKVFVLGGGYRPCFHPICLSVWMSVVCFIYDLYVCHLWFTMESNGHECRKRSCYFS